MSMMPTQEEIISSQKRELERLRVLITLYETIIKESQLERRKDMELYLCKKCGKKGTKEELRHHICKGFEKHYEEDDDDAFLDTLLVVGAISSLGEPSESIDIPDPTPEPSIEPGGGEFGGGGASSDFGSSDGGCCGGGD